MSVWVERPGDNGSAVWGCEGCQHGAWCRDQQHALNEAVAHAAAHGGLKITMLDRTYGPRRNTKRDRRIHKLKAEGLSIRAIANTVGISTAGVIKTLKRNDASS